MATKLRVFLILLVSSITTDSKLSEKREVFPKSMMAGNNPEDATVNDAASSVCVSCYKMEKMLLELKNRVESIDNLIEKQLADLTANANCKPKSCSDLKVLDPSTPSGAYVIDPDGKGGLEPFTVYCDMSDKNGVGVTVISHDSESRMLVHGCNGAGCYRRDIHYTGANLSQLASLASVSLHCEQFVKYECHGSSFVYGNEAFGWWVSRHGIKMNYWGGASPGNGEQICACGMTNSCANSARACNCDKNDLVWREDSGLLTDKTQLPVKQLRFGDTGDKGEQGYHTLGKLKCYGIA